MMMILRSIIIDDEYLARQRLEKLLDSFDEINVISTCRNGKGAIESVELKEPDLIFLDIQMPDMDGFTVLSKLKQKPYVIFTTAYDQFALKAFEINAVDYLLKPFDEERLKIAIKRILELKQQQKASILEHKLKNLLYSYSTKETDFLTEINIVQNGRTITIFTEDIIYFKSDGNYVQIITSEKTYLYRKTMNTLYDTLDQSQFLRIHRSILINKTYIHSTNYTGNNEYKFKLKNGETLISSRSYKTLISGFINLL